LIALTVSHRWEIFVESNLAAIDLCLHTRRIA